MKVTCFVIDDEPLARGGIIDYIKKTSFLEFKKEFSSAVEAMEAINTEKPDLIFLDIQMPGITGIDFVSILKYKPMIIFTTAYQEYAIKAFELDVVDYLLKPVSYDRFLKAAAKALSLHESQSSGSGSLPQGDFVFIKTDKKYIKLPTKDILYVEGLKDYVKIFTRENYYLALVNLKNMESQLPSEQFMRIHKSCIVGLANITSVEGNMVFIGKTEIPIGKEYKDQLFERIINKNLIKR